MSGTGRHGVRDAVLRHTCAAAAAEEATVHCSQPPGDAPTPEPSMWRCIRAICVLSDEGPRR